jgi:hypothetical protein
MAQLRFRRPIEKYLRTGHNAVAGSPPKVGLSKWRAVRTSNDLFMRGCVIREDSFAPSVPLPAMKDFEGRTTRASVCSERRTVVLARRRPGGGPLRTP